MSKRTAIITIIVVLLAGTALLYFIIGGKAPSGGPSFSTSSPFGLPPNESGGGGAGGSSTIGGPNGSGGSIGLPLVRELAETPVAGYAAFVKNGSITVRYVDRASGHVFDANPATLEKVEIVNATVPKIYQALFKPDGSGFIARTLADDGETVVNTAIALVPPAATSSGALYSSKATILRSDLSELAVTPADSLLYEIRGGGAITLSAFDGSKPRSIFSSPYTSWQIIPLSGNSTILATRPSSSASGYAYLLSLSAGSLTKLLGPLPSLSVKPSLDGRRLAYGHADAGGYALTALNRTSGVALDIIPTTLPEKCVWSVQTPSLLFCAAPVSGVGPNAPDAWYQGTTRYSDRIWRFNTDTNTVELLLDPKKSLNMEIDAMDLSLDSDENFLFFINKADLSLWSIRLER